jgi:glutamate 5-kinase
MKKKLVLKIGTSTLTNGTERIKRGKMEDIAQQLLWLQERYDILLVSSGAVAAAKQTIRLNGGNSNDIAYKQALAAIGQPFLMKRYQEVFDDYHLPVAQCLLTYRDVHDAGAMENILNTFQLLWQNNFIPIINENDTVATEEIKFGDNDKLAALVAILIKADLLILASDMNGLYDMDPRQFADARLIRNVTDIHTVKPLGGVTKSEQGTGGIASKLIAAELCMQNKIEMWIVNGQEENFIKKAMEDVLLFTRFK